MIINYLIVENFKSFKERTFFDLEVKQKEQNIILIEALNGIGKTSFLQAMNIVFFGLGKVDFDKYISYGHEKEKMILEVEFYNTNDFKTYKVHREYFNNDNETAIISIFKLYMDEVLISDFDEDQWKLFLQTEFPQEISSFFFFDGEKIQEMIDYKNPREIKIAIEKILGIEDLRNLRDNLIQIKSKKLRDFSYDQDNVNAKSLNLQLIDLNANKKSLQEQISKNNKEIEEISKELYLITKEMDSLMASGLSEEKEKELEKYNQTIRNLEKEKYLLEKQLEDFLNFNLDSFLLVDSLATFNKEIAQAHVNSQKLNPSSIIEIVKKLYYPYCIHCGNKYNKDSFAEVEKKLTTILEENNRQLGKQPLDIENYNRSTSVFLSKPTIDINKILDQLEQIDIKTSELKREINAIKRTGNSKEQPEKRQTLTDNYASYTNEKIKLEREVNSLSEDLVAVENKISSLELELEGLVKNAETNKMDKEAIDLISNILSALDEYISVLVVDKKIELREKTEYMFKLLSNTDKYDKVEISDTYQVSVYDKNGKEQELLSSGFKQVLMTSLIWALKECSDKNIPVIIDTPLARLDPTHRINMLTKYFPIAAPQVIILSQPSEITEDDLKNTEWTKHLRNSSYIQMDRDEITDSSILNIISI